VKVTLDDAPSSVAANGIEPDLLVVHQQDIQAVVNALWSGGAEAMTIQGQRVISTTAVKCVGNTVVLHGIPYSPPYDVVAIVDQARLLDALAASEPIEIYQQYVASYGLVFREKSCPWSNSQPTKAHSTSYTRRRTPVSACVATAVLASGE
jgi:uncharacterized protein YlxW (UPF0749 family)